MEFINGWTKETVIEHVKKEFKGKSVSYYSDGSQKGCVYRGVESKKCIAGCFIPDEQYIDTLEGNNASCISLQKLNCFPLDSNSMDKWQSIHDNNITTTMPLQEQLDILLAFLEEE